MTIDPELRQMLIDAHRSRMHRSWIARCWHAAAERIDIVTAGFKNRQPKPKGPFMLIDDIRHATRRITSKPGTAIACVAMLSLAIGVTAAMFTVADHMLLRPAPFKDVARIKQIWVGQDLKKSQLYLKSDLAKSFRECPAFEMVSFFAQDSVFIEGTNGIANKGAYWVSVNAFDLLGVKPLLGRTFVDGEGRPGSDRVIVISERMWRSDFGSDPAIVGRDIPVGGAPMKVVGVMPDSVRFPYESTSIWRPYDIDNPPTAIASYPITVFARLTRGVSDADASRVAAEVSRPFSRTPDRHGIILRSVGAGFLDDYSKTAIRVLLSGVGLVFLVLCANAANLILARTNARRHEFGVCSSLGASRGRLIRQVFFENALIGLASLTAGLVLTWALVALARGFLPEAFLLRTLNPLQLDARVFGVAAALALSATIISGLPPAWIGTKLNAADSLRVETRGGSESKGSRSWTRALLIGEVALASALLVGAGVLTASFVKLVTLDPGVSIKNVTTMWVTLPEFYFKDRPARAAFAMSLRDQIRSLPGVGAVTLSFGLPPDGGGFGWGHLVADGVPLPGTDEQTLFNSYVTPEFFDVYGVKLLQGRTFDAGDDASAVIVSERLAAMLWPGRSPLGHTFQFHDAKSPFTVIGVAHEIRSALSDPREDLPEYYMKFNGPGGANVMLGMRCDGSCPSESTIRQRAHETDARALVAHVDTMESAYLLQFARPRAAASLALSFAVISVLAAAGGLFSILTYAVNRRRREFGVRSAMGARPDQLRGLILKDGLTIAVLGLGIGAVLTFALNRTLESLSFGITAGNLGLWASVALIVGAVTLLASWRPAVNAMRSDPIALLRDN